jgi:hypothetical protein
MKYLKLPKNYLFLVISFLLLIISILFVIADSHPVETPTVPVEYAETYENYDQYYVSVDYYNNPSSDMIGYDFSSFTDWSNLNWDNPSLYQNSYANENFLAKIPADQVKNIPPDKLTPSMYSALGTRAEGISTENFAIMVKNNAKGIREGTLEYQEDGGVTEGLWNLDNSITSRLNSEVSADPMYVNEDQELMKTWIDNLGFICETTCAVKSYDSETGMMQTVSQRILERNIQEYGSERALGDPTLVATVSFNTKDPYFEGATITDSGEVILEQGVSVLSGAAETLTEGDTTTLIINNADPNLRSVVVDNSYSGNVIFRGGGVVELGDHVQFSGDSSSEIVISGSGNHLSLTSTENSELSLYNPSSREYLTLHGEITSVELENDFVTINTASPTYISAVHTYDSGGSEDLPSVSFTGSVTLDLNDVEIKQKSVVNEIIFGLGTTFSDIGSGFSGSVLEDTTLLYSKGSCSEVGNCIEFFVDPDKGKTLVVGVEDNNEIDIQLVTIELDDPIDVVHVRRIDEECNSCKITINDNNRASVEFSKNPVVARGDLSYTTVGQIETTMLIPVAQEGDNDELEEHSWFINNGQVMICSDCTRGGVLHSETMSLSGQEELDYNYIFALRMATLRDDDGNPLYGSEWNAKGKIIYAHEKNKIESGTERASTYTHRTRGTSTVQRAYDCIGLAQCSLDHSTGRSNEWKQPWVKMHSSGILHDRFQSTSQDLVTEFYTTRESDVPAGFVDNPDVTVRIFDDYEQLTEYVSQKNPGSLISYYSGGNEHHVGIKGNGFDTIEAHVGSGEISLDEDKLQGHDQDILITTVRDRGDKIVEAESIDDLESSI